jgi:hypothetical protein
MASELELLALPTYTVVEKVDGKVHVSKPDGLTYVIENGHVVDVFVTTTTKVVPIVYLSLGSTYTHVINPKPSAPPAEPEQLEAQRQREQAGCDREDREQRARTALLKLVLHRRSMAMAATSTV